MVKFELKAECTFSGGLEAAKKDIESAIAQANEVVFKKGVPKGKETEAAEVTSWNAAGKKLDVTIVSGRYVRAHVALFRLTKLLSEALGKKYRIGLRVVTAEEYKISLPLVHLSEQAKEELSKIGCEIKSNAYGTILLMRDLDEAKLRGHLVDRMLKMVEEISAKDEAPAAPAEAKVVQQGMQKEHHFKDDPLEVAKKLGWIEQFPGRGQWIYATPYAELLKAIEDILIEKVITKLGFKEFMLPKLIPLEVMQKMPGYLDEMPDGMYYVCPPPREPEVFADFKRELKLTKQVPVDKLKECLKEPSYVLAPAQCEPFYEFFAGKRVKLEDLPVKAFDRSGWTYRWEGGGVEGLTRVQEFRRIELIFLGKPDDVVKIRDDVKDKSVEVAEELGLEWRVTVATPFYMRGGGVAQDLTDSREIAVYDLETLLPYNEKWLELGSFNVHKTKFVETFKIKEAKNREVWTGCCGFGSSRWTVAFLAQHGFDSSKWPKHVRDRVGPLSEPPRIVK
jgi:seryl-tRNA synthetase